MSKRKQGRRPAKNAAAPARPATIALPSGSRGVTALLFAPAILVGALLLFAVQPLIARYVLPWFGGGPGVWTACMLFFQALLLGGYLYAHLSVKFLPTRGQVVLHALLLAGSLAMIPIIPSDRWRPADAAHPVGRILVLLAVTIGLPYLVLSATSPLLQAWFVRVRPGVSPYRLFALTNLGSLLALIAYPTLLEPLFSRREQAWGWSFGLIAFVIVCGACAIYVWRVRPLTETTPAAAAAAAENRGRPALSGVGGKSAGAGEIAIWIALPFVGCVNLLATTNTLSEDVAVTPLLWVVTLALYLLTYVIAFDSPRWYPRTAVIVLLPLATLWVLRLVWFKTSSVALAEQFIGYLVAMFVVCLFCHGELARLKPDPNHLTRYYLTISLGGALGGVFVGVVAPNVFTTLLEMPLSFVAVGALAFASLRSAPVNHGKLWATLTLAAALVLLAAPVLQRAIERSDVKIVARSRNFYGTLLVSEGDAGGRGEPVDRLRELQHGTTSHGGQFLAPPRRHETTLYYGEGSGVSFALHATEDRKDRKVGLVGLGVGTLAAYAKSGDEFRFYEINPDVVRMANEYFTFLKDSPAAKIETVLGDARLSLEREPPSRQFDVLVLDAFSGDAIPTHLLTAEAFAIYARHLKPGNGVLAVHFSNRSLDLGWLLVRAAHHLGMSASLGDPHVGFWIIMTHDKDLLLSPGMRAGTNPIPADDRGPLWTDDHMNLMDVIRWTSGSSSSTTSASKK
jgi:hypothetical protein